MKDPDYASKWGSKIQQMLPGDVIHDVAPTSKDAPVGVRMEAIDAGRLQRMRKLQRRAARNTKK